MRAILIPNACVHQIFIPPRGNGGYKRPSGGSFPSDASQRARKQHLHCVWYGMRFGKFLKSMQQSAPSVLNVNFGQGKTWRDQPAR